MLISNYNKRNHTIDLLRFLSACWVALHHFNQLMYYKSNDTWYRNFCKFGYLGVPVFFILSGYCMGIAENHVKTANEFIIKRLFRIFPPYWFSLIVACAIILLLTIIRGVNSVAILPKTPQGILAIIFLYTTPLSGFKTIINVYWTLPYELFFYFIIYLLMFLPKKVKLISLFLLTVIPIISPDMYKGFLFFFNEISTFMIGYSLYNIINKHHIWLGILLLILSFTGLFLRHPAVYFLTGTIVCSLIYIDNIMPIKDNFFSRLGDYSYSIYLIHIPVGIYLLDFLEVLKFSHKSPYFNVFLDTIILTSIIFASKIMYDKVELLFINMGKRVSKKYLLYPIRIS